MKLFAPKYYEKFKCIADKCTHSCCIGWEIGVDKNALELYRSLEGDYKDKIINSIDFSHTPHFILGENERCPHLDERGLCRIITNYGSESLCEICREHPRFYNDTPRGKEVGLGMACEEACRIILNSNDYDTFVQLENDNEELDIFEFDPTAERAKIYAVLKDCSLTLEDKLKKIYFEYRVSPFMLVDNKWQEIIGGLEYLDQIHKELFLSYSSYATITKEAEPYLERALAYFIYRHCSEAYDYEDFCARLGFCLFCERLLCSIINSSNEEIVTLARIVSEEIEYSTDNTEQITEEFLF